MIHWHHNSDTTTTHSLVHMHTSTNTGSSTTAKSSQKFSGDPDEYNVKEYFEYNSGSYYNIENDLVKYRMEQPIPGIKY